MEHNPQHGASTQLLPENEITKDKTYSENYYFILVENLTECAQYG